MTAQKTPPPIETFTLLTEAAPDLQERYRTWFDHYQPATPGERELLEMALHSSISRRRNEATLTALCNEQIRTAIVRQDRTDEDAVQHHRELLPTQPGRAVLGLQRTAMGCRYLIARFERFLCLVHDEGTLYGNDLSELINLNGARAGADRELLHESTGAFLTWLYALAAQPAPKDEQFVELGNERYMPEELRDRQTEHWLGSPDLCHALLVDLIERVLAALRERERALREQYEKSSRAGAEVREQVLRGPDGMQLARLDRMHRQNFLQAYQAFLKGRKESLKTGMAAGSPGADLEGSDPRHSMTAPMSHEEAEAQRRAASLATCQRAEGADRVAPGGKNGIGATPFTADFMRAAVRAEKARSSGSGPEAVPENHEDTGNVNV
jgi:hypothetical protein